MQLRSFDSDVNVFRNEMYIEDKGGQAFHLHLSVLLLCEKKMMAIVSEQASKPSGDWYRLLPDKVVFVTRAGGTIAASLNISLDELLEGQKKRHCLKRSDTTEEAANLTVFLASHLCHFATGASFLLDGGLTAI